MNNYNNILNTLGSAEQELLKSEIYKSDKNRDAKLDASILLAYVLSKPRSYLITWPEKELSIGQVALYFALIERRSQGEPIAYLTGQKEFFSLMFQVNNSVLIPRFETEILVEKILEKYKKTEPLEPLELLDLGTGSGVISIAIAKCKPNWRITAIDKSEAALELAKKNAKLHNINNIDFILSDWFSNINNKQFDCIVANPPYIAQDDPNLNIGDVLYEPKTALVSDNNGLYDIETIINQSYLYLKPKGILIFEHGFDQLQKIKNIINLSAQKWGSYYSLKDYSDHDRIMILEKTSQIIKKRRPRAYT